MEERTLQLIGSPAGGGADLPDGAGLGAVREEVHGITGAFNRIVSRVKSRDSRRFVESTQQEIGQ